MRRTELRRVVGGRGGHADGNGDGGDGSPLQRGKKPSCYALRSKPADRRRVVCVFALPTA